MDLNVVLNKRSYLPGEVVKILIKVSNTTSTKRGIEIISYNKPGHRSPQAQRPIDAGGAPDHDGSSVQLSVECCGTERVDPGWVHSLYQPQLPAQKEAKVRGWEARWLVVKRVKQLSSLVQECTNEPASGNKVGTADLTPL